MRVVRIELAVSAAMISDCYVNPRKQRGANRFLASAPKFHPAFKLEGNLPKVKETTPSWRRGIYVLAVEYPGCCSCSGSD